MANKPQGDSDNASDKSSESDGDSLAERESIDDPDQPEFWERLYSSHMKPDKPAKVPLPILPERKINLLRDQVRIINGKTPQHKRRARVACWMDSPETLPKSNRTTKERARYVRSKLEDRKDSEEDVYSSRCLL